jgi:hypothetical protein
MTVLAIRPLEDEPAAPVLDKATLDRRKINRLAMKHWSIVKPYLYDIRGYATGPASLDKTLVPNPNGERRPGRRCVSGLMGPSPYENPDGSGPGEWKCHSNGASGPDIISLVMHLGNTDKNTATYWLRDVVDLIDDKTKVHR